MTYEEALELERENREAARVAALSRDPKTGKRKRHSHRCIGCDGGRTASWCYRGECTLPARVLRCRYCA